MLVLYYRHLQVSLIRLPYLQRVAFPRELLRYVAGLLVQNGKERVYRIQVYRKALLADLLLLLHQLENILWRLFLLLSMLNYSLLRCQAQLLLDKILDILGFQTRRLLRFGWALGTEFQFDVQKVTFNILFMKLLFFEVLRKRVGLFLVVFR